MCVCVCVFVCVREKDKTNGRERHGEGEGLREGMESPKIQTFYTKCTAQLNKSQSN